VSYLVAFSLLGANILFNAIFSDTFNQFISLRTRDQISNPYKTTDTCLHCRPKDGKTGYSDLNDIKHYTNLFYSQFLCDWNIDCEQNTVIRIYKHHNRICEQETYCCSKSYLHMKSRNALYQQYAFHFISFYHDNWRQMWAVGCYGQAFLLDLI
jgi:hypothetical protein